MLSISYREANIKFYGNLTSKLISCLSMLVNMHTLILDLYWCSPNSRAAFCEARFSQVRRLTIPAPDTRLLLPCFPRLCAVISDARMNTGVNGNLTILNKNLGWYIDFMGLFDESGKKIEEIEGFAMTSESIKCTFLLSLARLDISWLNLETSMNSQ
jgi:hypothetical protein